MKILLCAATEMEIAPTIAYITSHQKLAVDILITGIGLTATTFSITRTILKNRPGLILQAGIAGAIDEQLHLGTVVAVESEQIGDLGVAAASGFQSVFDMKLLSPVAFPFQDGKLYNNGSLFNAVSLPHVSGITVNEISTNSERINHYKGKLNGQVETMEGAALHYVALMENIPFLQLRSLSNFVGERDKTKWMMNEAIRNLNHELQNLFKKLTT